MNDIKEMCSGFVDTLIMVKMYDNLSAIIYDVKAVIYPRHQIDILIYCNEN